MKKLLGILLALIVSTNIAYGETASSYKDALEKGQSTGKSIVIVFSASWCGPCQALHRRIKTPEVQKQLEPFIYLDVDVDEERDLARKFGIKSMPTYKCVKGGKIIGTGMGSDGFEDWLERYK